MNYSISLFNEIKFQAGKEGQIEALNVTEELSTRQRAVNDKQAINFKGGNMFKKTKYPFLYVGNIHHGYRHVNNRPSSK